MPALVWFLAKRPQSAIPSPQPVRRALQNHIRLSRAFSVSHSVMEKSYGAHMDANCVSLRAILQPYDFWHEPRDLETAAEEQVTMMVLQHRLSAVRQCDARRALERYDVIRVPDHLPSHLPPDEVSLRVASALRDNGGQSARPAATAWISDDLLQRTRRVWSKAYRRPVAEDEAIEILMNTKRFAEVLLKVRTEVQP